MNRLLPAIIVIACIFQNTNGARILGVFPYPGKSHYIVFSALTTALAERGHELVVLTAFPHSKAVANHTEISIEFIRYDPKTKVDFFGMKYMNFVDTIRLFWKQYGGICDTVLGSPEVQKLLHSGEKFDLVIVEVFFNECFVGFSHWFNAPMIAISSLGAVHWSHDLVGNPEPLSCSPSFLLPFTDRMNYFERLINAAFVNIMKLGRSYIFLPDQDRIARKYFGESMPPLWEIERNTSLVLLNNHFSLSYPQAYVPNMVEVGGMHVKKPKKLPQDLQKFLDEAKEGAIYFSMGTNIVSDQVTTDKTKLFLEAFSELPQKVLWKWESGSFPNQPKNVRVGKWMPQQDILGHPNIRLFITHGGLLGIQEAVIYGVPLVGMPMFGDQQLNMNRSVSAGIGLQLEYSTLTKDSFLGAIREVISNPKYRDNMRKRSAITRDQPETPLERAIFWTEYVIRHQGAHHMRSAAMDLTWYQYYLLDVIAVITLAVVLVLGVLFFTFRTVYRLFRGKKTKPKKD